MATWLADARVRKISFTGSTGVGRLLLSQAADRVVNSSMELGGNAPFVVAAETPTSTPRSPGRWSRSSAAAARPAPRPTASTCTPTSPRSSSPGFGAEVEKLTRRAGGRRAAIGPLISAAARRRRRAGWSTPPSPRAPASATARALPDAPGHFYPPTVLVDVPPDAAILREEIFGPVAPVVTWTDEAGAAATCVNDTEYGLAAYVFAGDLGHALRLGEAIDAGMVGINRGLVSDPVGAVRRHQAERPRTRGRPRRAREFQETQYLSVDWPA